MEYALAVEILRDTMLMSIKIAAPLLLTCLLVGIGVNLLQVATSIQDPGFSSIPRFVTCALAFLLLLPWMLHQMSDYMHRMAAMIPRMVQ